MYIIYYSYYTNTGIANAYKRYNSLCEVIRNHYKVCEVCDPVVKVMYAKKWHYVKVPLRYYRSC